MNQSRVIFHIDMNSFYASVEMARHPELRGKPLAIAGKVEDRRGIVVTSSYEARAHGVKTTMQVWEARRKCPQLIVKTPDFDLYRKVSRQLFDLLRTYTEKVEKVSVDEGYMDVTALASRHHPVKLAQEIQQQVFHHLQLPSSIGIAPNKFMAKMASDMKKPMGITILRKREMNQTLWPLPVDEMHGVGQKTAEKLKKIGLQTIGDIAHYPKPAFIEQFGKYGEKLHDRANGIDEREVDPQSEHEFKSISQSITLPKDLTEEEEVQPVLRRLAARLERKLKEKKSMSYQLSLSIRYNNWRNVTRVQSVQQPLQTEEEIYQRAIAIFYQHWNGQPIRLLGITVQSLEPMNKATKQLDLFTYEKDAQKEPLYDTLYSLEKKFGPSAIHLGWKEDPRDQK
ncbi:DNA polymerase-4 [Pullulanibacillus pueri]|uniref:DNA polymerase IV n=1 Tax=Pullulanibacillus pueri TaxID=1437324 RepID=A0A8J2ZUZ9_9BACL|nr:DNA polymerase IV [Pullulanibacillus pueri]MBM7681621.1 DNA polymerase-4 [Pullulanibacillus pueri]GGH79422.1 DNA polymerase IV 1 [Pullulanibacillus pueri]